VCTTSGRSTFKCARRSGSPLACGNGNCASILNRQRRTSPPARSDRITAVSNESCDALRSMLRATDDISWIPSDFGGRGSSGGQPEVPDIDNDRSRSGVHGAMPKSMTRRTAGCRTRGSPRWRRSWMRAGACLTLSSLVACASLGKQSTQPDMRPWPEIRPDVRVESLRARMYEYSITFAAEVDLAAAAIERRAADANVRRNALLWRVRAIPEMRKALSAGASRCPHRRVDPCRPDASALQRRRRGRRLRPIPD
jgi:hypothetical protein